ncbi:hypothetical protein P8452_07559 [Trifolium repens]|nr:hypothetical protein P8452_07559 [Trifolium repens]
MRSKLRFLQCHCYHFQRIYWLKCISKLKGNVGVAFNTKFEIYYYFVHIDNGTVTLKSDFKSKDKLYCCQFLSSLFLKNMNLLKSLIQELFRVCVHK